MDRERGKPRITFSNEIEKKVIVNNWKEVN